MGTAVVPGVIADFEQSKGVIGSINYYSGLSCDNETHIITNPTVPFVGREMIHFAQMHRLQCR